MPRPMRLSSRTRSIAVSCFVAGCAAHVVFGGTFTVKNGTRDWTLPASYVEGSVPSAADDIIDVPENTTVYLDLTTAEGLASLALVNTVQRIRPLSPTSVLDITVGADQGVQRLERPFNYAYINDDSTHIKWGELVKRGLGELELANGNGSPHVRDFKTKITVKEGTLALPQQWPRLCYVSALTVDAGATLVTAFNADNPGSSSNTWTVYYMLQGGGTITNRSPSSAYRLEAFSGLTSDCGNFSGKITGNITLYNAGYVDFTGTANDTIWDFNLGGRRTGVASFGMRGQPSSIGAGNWINVYPAGGTLGYVGQGGETTDRYFAIATTNASFTLDAGTTGGVTFTGMWKWWRENADKKSPWLRVVYLIGENSNECVFGGDTADFVSEDATATPVTGYFVKRGSGVWRFAEKAGRNHAGGYWVENGTLRYDSLEEAGRICALGTSTNRTTASAQDLSKLTSHASHAFVLGNRQAVGVFEYTGTNGYFCGTRPLVLNTNGVFRTNARKPIRFAGVSNFTTTPATLTLDGTSTCTNEMLDISNGSSTRGPVSVVKDGTGTWKLGGNQTFTGSLTVKKGKLIVKQTEPGPYTWFRFTATDYCRPSGTYGNNATTIARLALFSATNSTGKGTQQVGWKSMTYATNYVDILPGQVAIQDNMPMDFTRNKGKTTEVRNNTPEKMFFPTSWGYGLYLYNAWGALPKVQKADAATHIPIILRLPEGSPEIIAFDYISTFGSKSTAGICGYKFEGSVDGMHWETVAETDNAPLNSASYYWVYGQNENPINESEGSCPFVRTRSTATYNVLNNVSDITVKSGAILEAEGDVTLSKLTVDATDAGTISGFAFAETGTLNVTNFSGDNALLPLTVTGDTAANLKKWTLRVNGETTTKMRISVNESGRLSIFHVGMTIIIR